MTHIFIESIKAFPNSCSLCVHVRGGENAELSATLWFNYNKGELHLHDGEFDGEIGVVKFLIMHQLACAMQEENKREKALQDEMEKKFSVSAGPIAVEG